MQEEGESELSMLNPELLNRSSHLSRNALVFLRDLLRERAQIEQNYAEGLRQWVEKQQYILRKSGRDQVVLDNDAQAAVSFLLSEAGESAYCHSEAAQRTLDGPHDYLTRMIKDQDDVENILEDYQTSYDYHMRLVDQSKSCAKKFEKALSKHSNLRKNLVDARENLLGHGREVDNDQHMLQIIDAQLKDSSGMLRTAHEKCNKYSEHEMSHRDQFIEEVKAYTEMINVKKSEELRNTHEQMLMFLRALSDLHGNAISCKGPLQQAIQYLETADIKFAVGIWEKHVTEKIKLPKYQFDPDASSHGSDGEIQLAWEGIPVCDDSDESDTLSDDEGVIASDYAALNCQMSRASRRRPGAARPRNPHLNGPWSTLENRGKTFSDSIMEKTKLRENTLTQTRSFCPESTEITDAEMSPGTATASHTDLPASSEDRSRREENLRRFDQIIGSINSSISCIPETLPPTLSTKHERDLTRATPVRTNAWEFSLDNSPRSEKTSPENFQHAYQITRVERLEPDELQDTDDEEETGPTKDRKLKTRRELDLRLRTENVLKRFTGYRD